MKNLDLTFFIYFKSGMTFTIEYDSLGKDFLNLLYLLFTPENSIKSVGGSIAWYLPSTAFAYVAIISYMLSDSSESNILENYFLHSNY